MADKRPAADHEAGGIEQIVNKSMDAVGGALGRAGAAMSSSADDFVKSAAISDMFEIEAGHVATSRARDQRVREAAERMVRDHTESSDKLRSIAEDGPADLPREVDSRRASMLAHLREASDEDFDKTYVDQQVMAHKEAVTLMHHYRDSGDNERLRGFAGEISPVIEGHLASMEQLAETF